MLHALGAASAAIDALQALTSSKPSSKSTGFGRGANNPFELSSDASTSIGAIGNPFRGGSPLSQETMSAWLAIQGSASATPAARSDVVKKLFSEIDVNADGDISKLEFGNALGAGGTNLAQAIHVFGRMDTSGDSSVSLGEMMSALNKGPRHQRQIDSPGASADAGRSNSDPLLKDIRGASTSSVSNSDGSITTTLTYGDGSRVSMTSATSASASSATNSYNYIEQMIQRQAQAIKAEAGTSLSV